MTDTQTKRIGKAREDYATIEDYRDRVKFVWCVFRDSTGVELPPGSIHKDNISGNNTTKDDSFGKKKVTI